MLRLVNELRAERDLKPLRLNADLNTAAQTHSKDQATNNFLGHKGSDGSDFGQRVRRTNYQGSPRAENAAAGNTTVEATFGQWKNSSDHLRNMLLSDINEMGLGHDIDQDARYTHYWTQVFGKGNTVLSVGDVSNHSKNTTSIFPNPADQIVTINFKSSTQKPSMLHLTTLSGKLIRQIPIDNSKQTIQIKVADLPQGIYLLKTEKNEAFSVVKS